MTLIVIWIVLAIGLAAIAEKRGRSGIGFFFTSLLLSPVVALVLLFATESNGGASEERLLKAGTHRRCPSCAELMRMEAAICPHCRRDLREIR